MESVNETWWYTYRRARNKARHQLSFEMIVRKTLSEIWQEYLNHCSVAGVKQIRERNRLIKHRFMWVLVLGAAIGCAVYMLMDVWSATLTKPLIVTMDSSTYPIADIDFPAVAICNINRISKKNLKNYAEHVHRSRTHNYTLEQIEWYLREAGRLLDYSYNATDSAGMLSKFPRRNDGKQDDVVKIMEKLAPNCREMLLRCIWNGKIKNCSEIFFDRRTRLGHCCAFNYVLQYNSIGRPHRSKKLIGPVKRQSQYGWQHGLVVVMDAQLDDYAYPLRNVDGFDILLFDPNHYADPSAGHVLQRTVQPSSIMMFDMQSVKQVATEEVRKYPLSTRKCLFHDDLPDLYGEMYSYSACIANCKYNTIRALCKCSPYFIPIAKNEVPVCSLADLQCLNKYKEKIITMYPFNASSNQELQNELLNSLYCPECQPDCELTKHKLKTHKLQFVDGNIGGNYQMPEIVKDLNLNVSNTCIMCVFQGTSDGVLDRLDVVSYWYEILSNVGGFAGMLMGFSIITVVEIIYYLVVRFALIFIRNFKTYY